MNTIKRDRLDIMLMILGLLTEPQKKTHILYKANVNYSQLVRYLTLLEELDMVNCQNEEYIITDKGRMFLSLLAKTLVIH